jgi:N-acetyltransferase
VQTLATTQVLVPPAGVLTGARVELVLLRPEHATELLPVVMDPELWRWTLSHVESAADLDGYVAEAIQQYQRGQAVPFLIRERTGGRAVGSTRFCNIDTLHARAEIGFSWVAAAWQRTAVNTEAKYLLLRHAFEGAGVRRVEFRTDALNARSRAALARIGATEEGTLRQHMVTARGRVRDTVYFSILHSEWPRVKDGLEALLAR